MARMHSGAKGKSGSKKPIKKVPSWAPFKEKDVEKLIVKYAKAGKSSSEIGLLLRDAYGINSVKALTGKKVTAVLEENNLTKELQQAKGLTLVNYSGLNVKAQQDLKRRLKDAGSRMLVVKNTRSYLSRSKDSAKTSQTISAPLHFLW